MKGRWIGCAGLALFLLTRATLPYPAGSYSPGTFGPPVITAPRPDYAPELVLWAAWVQPLRRRHRPRRYRLSRQQRRRWQLRQRRIRKRRRHAAAHRQRWGHDILLVVGVLLALLVPLYLAASPGRPTGGDYMWGAPGGLGLLASVAAGGLQGDRPAVVGPARRHYQPEFDHCLLCGAPLRSRRYLNWRKTIQMLQGKVYVTSRGRYCPQHPEITYLAAAAAQLSLPHSTYDLDVVVRIGYQRDYQKMTYAQIHQSLPAPIRVSERHVGNLYREYLALLACAAQLDVNQLRVAAAQYGGLILAVDGLEPEGGQPQLWVAREVLTGTLLAAGWLPRVDEDTLKAFLAPVAALDLPLLATVSDKQAALIKALAATWSDLPHQYCQAHYLCNAVTPIYEADERLKVHRWPIIDLVGPMDQNAKTAPERVGPILPRLSTRGSLSSPLLAAARCCSLFAASLLVGQAVSKVPGLGESPGCGAMSLSPL